MNRHLLMTLVVWCCWTSLMAQTDTVPFSLSEFLAVVKDRHPVAQQADLLLQRAEAGILQAKGAFDPYAYTDLDEKRFDGTHYFRLAEGGLKVPTPFGVSFKAGFEQHTGELLNPENKTPESGLWSAGVQVPLLQGLLYDSRRAALQRAKVMNDLADAERQLLLNELIFEAGNAYLAWFEAYRAWEIYREALDLAEQRYEAVVAGAQLGDRPAIDTLEAGIQVQNRLYLYQQAELEYLNTRAFLSVFLWDQDGRPLELQDRVVPALETSILPDPTGRDWSAHPKLRQFRFKLEQLEVDRRLKKEMLKPRLDLQYQALAEPVNNNPLTDYSIDNYKWGFNFSMPLLLRKARGGLQMADLKIRDTQLDMQSTEQSIGAKVEQAANTWEMSRRQLELAQQTARDYSVLLEGEQNLFESGESSLFLVNARESGYVNARLKALESRIKNWKARLKLEYALGQLGEN